MVDLLNDWLDKGIVSHYPDCVTVFSQSSCDSFFVSANQAFARHKIGCNAQSDDCRKRLEIVADLAVDTTGCMQHSALGELLELSSFSNGFRSLVERESAVSSYCLANDAKLLRICPKLLSPI